MSPMPNDHRLRSRPARRPAERSGARPDGRQDRVHRSSQRRAGCRRSRWPRSSARSGCRRWRTPRSVFAGITRRPGTRYTALVPNAPRARTRARRRHHRGGDLRRRVGDLQPAQHQPVDRRRRSTTYARRPRTRARRRRARPRLPVDGVRLSVRGRRARRIASSISRNALLDIGVYEVAVSDTIGIAHPGQVRRVLDGVVGPIVPAQQIALHFHDTRGTALANVLASLDFGITTFDASAGGLGGCPYAPGAAGNLATEDLAVPARTASASRRASRSTRPDRGVGAARSRRRAPAALALPPGVTRVDAPSTVDLMDAVESAWIDALVERHTASLTRPELLKAIRALSARYVERRHDLPGRSPLDSAGKRAAFASFYAPLHFFTTQLIVRELPARRPIATIVDLGCGTGVASAAWARSLANPPALSGVDRHPWAVEEARWTWRRSAWRAGAARGCRRGSAPPRRVAAQRRPRRDRDPVRVERQRAGARRARRAAAAAARRCRVAAPPCSSSSPSRDPRPRGGTPGQPR